MSERSVAQGPETGLDLELALAASRTEAGLFGTSTSVRLGRYVVLDRIGAGAMGSVYEAFDPDLDRRIAVKLLSRRFTPDSDGARARLVREARALGRLAHPNVVGVHDVGTIGAGAELQVFIAMELVSGLRLTQWMAQRRSPKVMLDAVVQAGRGLAAAHAAGLIHRDFKPDNVMVSDGPEGVRVRVVDFGLARATEIESSEDDRVDGESDLSGLAQTARGALVGTPAYMAPEQLRGAVADARSDQFSYCTVVWEALSGARPFQAKSSAELIEEIACGPRAPRGISRSLLLALRRGLSSRPEHRFATMVDLLEAIQRGPIRRRRAIAFVASTSIACASLAAVAVRDALTERGCQHEAEEIEVVWNEGDRARLAAAFAESGVPFAADAWSRVAPRLDAHARGWSEVAAAICHADAVADATQRRQHTAGRACLAELREEFAALVEAASTGGLATVQHVGDAVATLTSPETCTDARQLALRDRFAVPQERRDEIASLQRRVAEAAALRTLGREAEAWEEARVLAAAADANGWPPLIVRANLEAGIMASRAPDGVDGSVFLERALQQAAEAGDDAGVADSLIALVDVVGRVRGEHERARGFAATATAFVARVEPEPALRTVKLHYALGTLALARGELDESLARLTSARDLAAEVLGPEHPLHASVLSNLAALQLRRNDLAAAKVAALAAVARRTEVLGEAHPATARALANLALIHESSGDHALALAAFERSREIRERALGAEHPDVASVLVNIGLIHTFHGAPRAALPVLRRALEIRQRAFDSEHPEVAHALVALGECEARLGDLDAALAHAEQALRIRERRFGPEHWEVALALDVIAEVYAERGAYDHSLATISRALRIREQAMPGSVDHAKSLADLAVTHLQLGHLLQAREYNQKSLAILEAQGVHGVNRATSELREAAVARGLGDLDDAARWLERARASMQGERGAEGAFEAEAGLQAAARGDWGLALEMQNEALSAASAGSGEDSSAYALVQIDLAEALIAVGRFAEARVHAAAAFAVLDRHDLRPADRARAEAAIARAERRTK